jgi:hypothetical protein
MVRGFAFAEDQSSIGTDALCRMGCDPFVLRIGQALESGDGAQSSDDLLLRRRLQRRSRELFAERGGRGQIETGLCDDPGLLFAVWAVL